VLARAIKQDHLADQLQAVRDSFPTPEDINDDPVSAPSKRIIALYPRYNKVVEGGIAAQIIGVDRMRAQCSHFRAWLDRLVALPPL